MRLWVGTSGWNYRHWRGGTVYPRGLPQNQELNWYTEQFPCVELNASFYRLPQRSAFEGWRTRTPDGFRFAVKASRYLTHIRRLRDPEEPVRLLSSRAEALGRKLAVVLVQLPPGFAADLGALDATLRAFPAGWRVAVEVRHDSWFTDACYSVLADHDAALVLADRRGRLTPLVRTAAWGYVRFHEGRALPPPRYGKRALDAWVDRVVELWPDGEAYAFFNNDPGGWAVRNAITFARNAHGAGVEVVGFERGLAGGRAAVS